jgi:hypothetical protein
MQELKEETLRLLAHFYNVSDVQVIPVSRHKALWKEDNKFGFFRAVVQYGSVDEHVTELHRLLIENNLCAEDHFSKAIDENTFIDKMYNYYIFPFKQYNRKNGSSSSLASSSVNSCSLGSKGSYREGSVQAKLPTHRRLKKELEERDRVCLFCWKK